MTTDRHDTLVIEQSIAAPLEAVWRAWTTEPGLATWWWVGWDDTTYELDVRVGGRYRIAAASVGIVVSGEFLAVEAPHHLAMTWVWEDADGAGPLEHVAVDLTAMGSATNVTVHHTGPWTTPEPADDYRQGWEHVLGALAVAVRDVPSS